MDLQEIFEEEWRQIIAKMIVDGTLKRVEMPNNEVAKYVCFSNRGDKYFSLYAVNVFNKHNQILDVINLPYDSQYLFHRPSENPTYFSVCLHEMQTFFTTVRNAYSTHELQKLLLFTIHDFYYDLQETHLSNVEMVLRDCYLMKYIQKY